MAKIALKLWQLSHREFNNKWVERYSRDATTMCSKYEFHHGITADAHALYYDSCQLYKLLYRLNVWT